MIGCTKRNCPFVNPSECIITTGCPFYTNEAIEKTGEAIADVVSELISKIKQREAIDMMQEIKNQIGEMQTYKLFSDDNEKYISRDEVLQIIDEKIKRSVDCYIALEGKECFTCKHGRCKSDGKGGFTVYCNHPQNTRETNYKYATECLGESLNRYKHWEPDECLGEIKMEEIKNRRHLQT